MKLKEILDFLTSVHQYKRPVKKFSQFVLILIYINKQKQKTSFRATNATYYSYMLSPYKISLRLFINRIQD